MEPTEDAVLGLILLYPELMEEVSPILDENSFINDLNSQIFMAMNKLYDDNSPIDEITVYESGGFMGSTALSYIANLAVEAETLEDRNCIYYARSLKENQIMRLMASVSKEILNMAQDPKQNVQLLLDHAESSFSAISTEMFIGNTVHIKEAIKSNIDKLEEMKNRESNIIGIPTGFIDLDLMISGLIAPDLSTIAGRPGSGKTTFALNIGENAICDGGILIFSREMSVDQNTSKIICSSGDIDTHRYKTGRLNNGEWDSLFDATQKLSDREIYFNSKTNTLRGVISEIKRLNKKLPNGLSFVIVDHIGLIENRKKGRTREEEVSEISKSMKAIALDLNIPVIQLSQLNRALEKRSDKRPVLSDLRESGSIEQDSDIILFVYRDDMYKTEDEFKDNEGEIIIAKHRNGPTGTIHLEFDGAHSKFKNIPAF